MTITENAAAMQQGATARLKAILDTLAAKAGQDQTTEPMVEAAAAPADAPDMAASRPGKTTGKTTGKSKDKNREETGPRATLGELIDALDERAYGLMLLLLALPCCLPFIYILPQIVALPMLALSAQLALGREAPWLPQRLSRREFSINSMRGTVERAERYLGWAERISHARLRALSDGVGGRITGALLMIPCASILVPLPLTNTTPGIGVAIAALGLVERDGLLIILGLTIGVLWVLALVFLGAEAISFAKDWLVGLVT